MTSLLLLAAIAHSPEINKPNLDDYSRNQMRAVLLCAAKNKAQEEIKQAKEKQVEKPMLFFLV